MREGAAQKMGLKFKKHLKRMAKMLYYDLYVVSNNGEY